MRSQRHGDCFVLFLVSLLLVVVAVNVPAAAAAADEEAHLLPRPLVIELPTAAEVPAEVWCASWRLAAEADNLAPWKAVPEECVGYVREYVTGVAYRSDLEVVAREASAYARAARVGDDGRDVWVFDVDETLLSNLPYYAEHGYGLELFDHGEFDKWVEKGDAPAIPSSLKLYKEVRELGFKTFLLTGRSEGHQGITVENLKKQGFHDWDKLILRYNHFTALQKSAVSILHIALHLLLLWENFPLGHDIC
ncbi:hypothetical protein ABZP36_011739 [Zizania latifolia]